MGTDDYIDVLYLLQEEKTLQRPSRTQIQMAPPELLQQTESLEDFFSKELEARSRFKLITKRDVTTHNSWTHNIEDFASGERISNYLYMHSDDAEEMGLSAKDLAKVSTATGSIILPVKYLDDLQRRTIAVPHGWGHQSSAMTTAKKTSGVNVNILAPDGIDHIEKVSGMSQLTGFDVDIEKYEGAIAQHSWSGLAKDQLITTL